MLLSIAANAQDRECFEKVVRPVFKNKCSMCHEHMEGKNWEDYDTAMAFKTKIRERAVVLKNMPPYGAPPLTAEELGILDQWTKE